MKKVLTLSIITMSLFISSCTVNSTILNPVSNENSTKIKNLKFGLEGENIYKTTHATTETWQSYTATLFQRTVANNILEEDYDEWGYIELKTTFDRFEFRGINIISWMILPPTILFANPLDFKGKLQHEISIYDSNKKLIKTYVFDDKKIIWVNIYNAGVVRPKAHMDMVNRILRKFENSIASDAEYINVQLEKAGKIGS